MLPVSGCEDEMTCSRQLGIISATAFDCNGFRVSIEAHEGDLPRAVHSKLVVVALRTLAWSGENTSQHW